jgi:hypothetical protein
MHDRSRKLCCFQPLKTLGLIHGGYKMAGNSTGTCVADHESLFHGPGVVTVHETAKAIVAVFAAGGVVSIYTLTFDEESFVLGEDSPRFFLVIAKLEAQIRGLPELGAVVVCDLALPGNDLIRAPTETSHTSLLAQVVLDDAKQISGDLVLLFSRQGAAALPQPFKGSKYDEADQEYHG